MPKMSAQEGSMTKRSSIIAYSKAAERLVAAELSDQARRLHAGEWGGPGDVDVMGPGFYAQVKHVRNVPAYMGEGFRQINEATAGSEITPLVIIRTKPGPGHEAKTYVVMEVEQWRKVYDTH